MRYFVKVLMYNGMFVDTSRLNYGIYTSLMPSIYNIDTSIQQLSDRIKELRPDYTDYVDNLSKCQLIEFELKQL